MFKEKPYKWDELPARMWEELIEKGQGWGWWTGWKVETIRKNL